MPDLEAVTRPDVRSLVATLESQLGNQYAPPYVKRDAHPKMHGCVQAVLRVEHSLPFELRQGVFAEPGTEYLAWVRFSNAFRIQHDLEFDTRGMAVKLIGVKGERLLADAERDTQDLLFATHDAFFLPNPKHYTDFAKATAQGPSAIFEFFRKRRMLKAFTRLVASALVPARNPLAITYFSQTPYQFGERPAVKLQARPQLTADLKRSLPNLVWFLAKAAVANALLMAPTLSKGQTLLGFLGLPKTKAAAEDFCNHNIGAHSLLRLSMAAFLANHDACFDINVQTQTDEMSMPTTDATARWRQDLSPFRRVATLHVPRQVFWPVPGMPPKIADAAIEMMKLGEDLSFNPWHGIAAHKPIGEINEARREIYLRISEFRRGHNGVRQPAPTRDQYLRLREIVQYGLSEPWPELGTATP